MSATKGTTASSGTGYGSRPVAIALTRGHRLTETAPEPQSAPMAKPSDSPIDQLHPIEQLILARWPAGHRIVVCCSLAGGTGRTTLAGLIAMTLADLPTMSWAALWSMFIGSRQCRPRCR